jgi:hypothetical protein
VIADRINCQVGRLAVWDPSRNGTLKFNRHLMKLSKHGPC